MEQLRYISYKNWESHLNPMLKAFDSIDHNCLLTKGVFLSMNPKRILDLKTDFAFLSANPNPDF